MAATAGVFVFRVMVPALPGYSYSLASTKILGLGKGLFADDVGWDTVLRDGCFVPPFPKPSNSKGKKASPW